MVGDRVAKHAPGILNLHDIHEEVRELIDARRDSLSRLLEVRWKIELTVEDLHHADAGTGRSDDPLCIFKRFQELPGDTCGNATVTRVERRLSAACLLLRVHDLDAEPLEDAESRHPRIRKELVNKARYEEGDSHLRDNPLSAVFLKPHRRPPGRRSSAFAGGEDNPRREICAVPRQEPRQERI